MAVASPSQPTVVPGAGDARPHTPGRVEEHYCPVDVDRGLAEGGRGIEGPERAPSPWRRWALVVAAWVLLVPGLLLVVVFTLPGDGLLLEDPGIAVVNGGLSVQPAGRVPGSGGGRRDAHRWHPALRARRQPDRTHRAPRAGAGLRGAVPRRPQPRRAGGRPGAPGLVGARPRGPAGHDPGLDPHVRPGGVAGPASSGSAGGLRLPPLRRGLGRRPLLSWGAPQPLDLFARPWLLAWSTLALSGFVLSGLATLLFALSFPSPSPRVARAPRRRWPSFRRCSASGWRRATWPARRPRVGCSTPWPRCCGRPSPSARWSWSWCAGGGADTTSRHADGSSWWCWASPSPSGSSCSASGCPCPREPSASASCCCPSRCPWSPRWRCEISTSSTSWSTGRWWSR